MKKQSLTISKSEAIEMYKTTCDNDLKSKLEKTFGIETFVKPTLINKLKTLSDVLKYNKTTLEKELPYKKPTNKRQKSLNASAIWLLIIETFNEGKEKDFNDTDQVMYVPYGIFKNGSFSYDYYTRWYGNSNVGFDWGFLDVDNMIYCTKQFNKEWNNFLLGKV